MKFPAIIALTLFFLSCKKDNGGNNPVVPPVVMSDLSVQFENRVGNAPLHLNLESYTTSVFSETFTVTSLRYYISNISLTNTGDTIYIIPADSSYFLIDQSNFDSWVANLKVPVGDYKTLQFVVGVDSARTLMDISKRTGILDPAAGANGMYWGTDSGYIFLNFEGTSTASPEAGQVFKYHIGGYGGVGPPVLNNLKTVILDLTEKGIAQVRTGTKSNLHLMVDIGKIFDSPGWPISIAANPVVGFEDFSTNVSTNYSGMFRHDHTEN